ncbi:MAG: 2-oxoglutarate dehydrogenase complex dihydrolipoyllysine-residue succinyltransferase [bacterium]|nr:2-oxoglutarate dehydrogenase complex dihydrolipoyllysine-residue succinyltransferase [bacterium]
MAIDVEIPELGESVTEAILVEWLKSDGDQVEVDEPLCVLETDKANVELPAPVGGVLRTIASTGDTIQVGQAIARIEEGATSDKKTVAPKEEKEEAPKDAGGETGSDAEKEGPGLSPAVRRLVTEHELDPSQIKGSGKGGRLIKQDVLEYIDSQKNVEPENVPQSEKKPVEKQAPKSVPEDGDFDNKGVRRVQMSKLRLRIAQRLVSAQQTAAMLTTFNEVDMSGVFALRKLYKERFQEVHGISLGLMSFFVRACALALEEFPDVNASIDGEEIVYHRDVHLGIAVSTERGLVVPVLRKTQNLSFARIESEIKRVAGAARDGKLGLDELSGGTFTITNGGVFGSMLSTPILNPPQTGILGMHAIQNRPVAVEDRVEVRPIMYLALTYDHRLVDGKNSVSFLVRVKQLVEDPARMMLEV